MIKITNYRLIKKYLISKSIIPIFITSEWGKRYSKSEISKLILTLCAVT